MKGPYDGEWVYIAILTSKKRKWRQVRALAFEIVKAPDTETAIRRAFPEGSEILSVRNAGHAIAIRLAEPRDQAMMPLEVDRPRWGNPERFQPND